MYGVFRNIIKSEVRIVQSRWRKGIIKNRRKFLSEASAVCRGAVIILPPTGMWQ
jgi:hypothetical protein